MVALVYVFPKYDFKKDNNTQYLYPEYDEKPLLQGVTGRIFVILVTGAIFSAIITSFVAEKMTVGISGGLMALLGYSMIHWRHSITQKAAFVSAICTIALGAIIPVISQVGHVSGLLFGMLVAIIHNVYDYYNTKKTGFSSLPPEIQYLEKNSNLYLLTGFDMFNNRMTKMSELILILKNPKKGFGEEYYHHQISYLRKHKAPIIQAANDIRQENKMPLSI